MTNERAVEILNLDLDILGQYGDGTAEAYKMAIQALEAQPSEDCISREEMLKYQQYLHGKMSNEENHKLWNFIKGLPSVTPRRDLAETSQDCISRQAVIRLVEQYPNIIGNRCSGLISDIKHLPSVKPQTVTEFADKCKECGKIQNEFFNFDAPMVKNSEAVSREAVIKNIKGWFDKIELNPDILIDSIVTLPSVTPKYTDEEIDKAQAVEQAYVDKMVELAVKEIKERYSDAIEKIKKAIDEMTEIHSDGEFYIKNVDAKWIISKYLCGAEMSGGGEDETDN